MVLTDFVFLEDYSLNTARKINVDNNKLHFDNFILAYDDLIICDYDLENNCIIFKTMFRTNAPARLLSLTVDAANAQQGAKRIRVGGWKRLKFNPNYYPVHEYGSPISKQKPVWQKNPRLPNNAHNVNKFFKTTNLKNVQRIYDEEEGERYLRSNEFESRMAMADSQANASNRFAKDTGTSEHPGIVPLHVRLILSDKIDRFSATRLQSTSVPSAALFLNFLTTVGLKRTEIKAEEE